MYKSDDFVVLRSWSVESDVVVTKQLIKDNFEELIRAAGYNISIHDIEIDRKLPAISLKSKSDDRYMGVYVYCHNNMIEMAIEGKGHQIKATDLVKLYHKAAGALSGMFDGYQRSRNTMRRFGVGGTASSLTAGASVAVGAAIGGSVRLVAKGVRALLRDQEAYDKEMSFYTLALGLGDYIVGGSDPENVTKELKQSADNNNEIAQYLLGNAYIEGRGVEVSFADGIRFYSLAAANGEKRSREILAVEYLYGENEYTIEEKETGLKYLKEMADGGNEDAATSIIDIYGTGSIEGIPADSQKMIEFAEIYAEKGNVYACMTLAEVYDSTKTNSNIDVEKYKDDKKALSKYLQVLHFDDSKYVEEVAMSLAYIYRDGRGTEENKTEEIHYYEIASSRGNLEAKRVLAYYYTLGIGIEKNHIVAQKLCKELIGSGNQDCLPIAYYCNYVIADEAKKYKVSMDNARKYISCENAEADKKAELQTYLAEQEELISKMSEEERREYLQERKPLFSKFKKNGVENNKKALLLIAGAIILVIAGTFIIKGLGNNNQSEESYSSAGDSIMTSSSDYQVTTERDETDIFINNDTEILVRTEVDMSTVDGNKELNNSVQGWVGQFEEQAENFRDEYSSFDNEDLEFMEPHSDAEFYGTDYPVYFYLRNTMYIPETDGFLENPRADEKVLSLIYNSYSETGGAHGFNGYVAGSFDVETGSQISFDSVSNDYDAFSNAVITYIANEVEKKGEEVYIFEEYEDTIRYLWENNATEWYMSDTGFVFMYSPYTLASYADGTIVVKVPYEEVADYMNDEYMK